MLFQSGSDYLTDVYSNVPYPKGTLYHWARISFNILQLFCIYLGNVMGQEIFRSGVIKGDTDYRIYRDYGQYHKYWNSVKLSKIYI